MAGETVITIIGNLTADPELRFTPQGAAVANFTVASTPRTFDRQAQEWKDGDALFMRCSVWRDAAEHVAESLSRGTRVICQGRLRQRSYETKEGEKRTVVELEVDEVGPSLRFAQARVERAQRSSGSSAPRSGGSDPWATAGASSGGFGGGYSPADEPPLWPSRTLTGAPRPPSARPGSFPVRETRGGAAGRHPGIRCVHNTG